MDNQNHQSRKNEQTTSSEPQQPPQPTLPLESRPLDTDSPNPLPPTLNPPIQNPPRIPLSAALGNQVPDHHSGKSAGSYLHGTHADDPDEKATSLENASTSATTQ
jgi:hypothetical protein